MQSERSRRSKGLAQVARLATLAALALLGACKGTSEPAPFGPPSGFTVGLRYHAGSILTGPQARVVDEKALSPAHALVLACEVVYVERLPVEGLEPLESLTRFVAAVEQGAPIVSHAPFLRSGSLARGAAAEALRAGLAAGRHGQTRALGSLEGVLMRGTTAVVYGERGGPPTAADEAPAEWHGSERGLHVSRTGGDGSESIELGLGLRDDTPAPDAPAVPSRAEDEPDPDRAARVPIRHELVLLQAIDFPGALSVALVIPPPHRTGAGEGLVLFLELRSPPSESAEGEAWQAHVVLAEAVREEVEASAAQVARAAHREQKDVAVLALMSAVLDAQQPGHVDAGALLGLSATMEAWLACDLLMVGDERLRDEFVRLLVEAKPADGAILDSRAAFGWMLDRCAWRAVADRLLSGEGELVAESIALRYAGELGRYPATILEGVEDAADSAALQRFLVQENLAFLRDTHPAARLRALEWLRTNATVPPGYDALDAPEARRAALDRFYESLASEGRAGVPAEGGS